MHGATRQVNERRRIHITAVGGSAVGVVAKLGVEGVKGLVALAQGRVGDRFRVTASARMIFAKEAPHEGGRSDDAARAREIETLLADDGVAALVTIRGGAWFTRILNEIDFARDVSVSEDQVVELGIIVNGIRAGVRRHS